MNNTCSYRETEEQNSNGCKLLVRKDVMLDSLNAKERNYDNNTNGIDFTIRKVKLMFVFRFQIFLFSIRVRFSTKTLVYLAHKTYKAFMAFKTYKAFMALKRSRLNPFQKYHLITPLSVDWPRTRKNLVVCHVTRPCPCMTLSITIKITHVISM